MQHSFHEHHGPQCSGKQLLEDLGPKKLLLYNKQIPGCNIYQCVIWSGRETDSGATLHSTHPQQSSLTIFTSHIDKNCAVKEREAGVAEVSKYEKTYSHFLILLFYSRFFLNPFLTNSLECFHSCLIKSGWIVPESVCTFGTIRLGMCESGSKWTLIWIKSNQRNCTFLSWTSCHSSGFAFTVCSALKYFPAIFGLHSHNVKF